MQNAPINRFWGPLFDYFVDVNIFIIFVPPLGALGDPLRPQGDPPGSPRVPPAPPGLQIRVQTSDFVRMSHAKSKVWDSPPDPPDPPDRPDQVSGGAVRDLTSSRTGGQDDGSLTNSLKLASCNSTRILRLYHTASFVDSSILSYTSIF